MPIINGRSRVPQTANGKTTAATMEAPPPLQVKKLSEKGRLPTRGSAFAAGYDIYAARDTTIPARGKALVDTDLSMAIPEGTCKSMSIDDVRPVPGNMC